MKYFHVDVFSSRVMSGNGLTVVFPGKPLADSVMSGITREFRQFETIFIFPDENGCFPVRIFTVDEELAFAGHPLVGAAAVIHHLNNPDLIKNEVMFAAGKRVISLESRIIADHFCVTMNQGLPEFIRGLTVGEISEILKALNLDSDDLHPGFPIEVVSTGLPYLLLPVDGCLEKAGICSKDFEAMLGDAGAKFVYVFDPEKLECRTWDNAGLVEDVATGSAAGPLCGYLVRNGFKSKDERILISQGRFTGRQGAITGWVSGNTGDIFIEGDVVFFASGEITIDRG